MTLTPAFGQKDVIALLCPKTLYDTSSEKLCYTHGNRNSCYSYYGFAIPLDTGGIPLHLVLDNKVPKGSPSVIPESSIGNRTYLLIDHSGLLWKISIYRDTENNKDVLGSMYIDRNNEGWWISPEANTLGETGSLLTGFLYTNPKQKDIDDFWFKHMSSRSLEWLHIPTIVEKLNKDFDPMNVPV